MSHDPSMIPIHTMKHLFSFLILILSFFTTISLPIRNFRTTIIPSPSSWPTRIGPKQLQPSSKLATAIQLHQSTCTLPIGINPSFAYSAGLGADLHIWSQSMCGAYENHIRLQTISGIKSLLPWNWLDQEKCKLNQDLSCYFNIRHKLCIDTSNTKKKVVIKGFVSAFCPTVIHDLKSRTRWRTATTEYLFGINGLTDVVRIEVKRQIVKVFGSIGNVPKDMITVHIRWNDKRSEMELVSIDKYVNAVRQIVQARNLGKNKKNQNKDKINIYISTEDPSATDSFRTAAALETNWNIYGDLTPIEHPKGVWYRVAEATSTKGRTGMEAIASLVIAMESNDFVLTTASNWSRLMDELRRSIVNRLCNNCTTMIDLREGQW